MSTAICKTCGKCVYWHQKRGSKLSTLRCPCGGKLEKYSEAKHGVEVFGKEWAGEAVIV